MTLQDFLNDMRAGEEPLKYSSLLQISGLVADEVAEFTSAWSSVSSRRRNDIIERLVELSEDNLDLDFSGIFKACLGDLDAGVRLKATKGLWECDDRTVVRPLIGLLKDDPSEEVRAAAGTALGRFAALARDRKLPSRDADRIRGALVSVIGRSDEELMVRRRAIEAASYLDFPERDGIIRQAYEGSERELQQSAIYAMGHSSDNRWLPTVLNEMESEDAAMRYEAASASGILGDESTVPY